MRLSILDQSPIPAGKSAREALESSIELGKLGDQLGYTRYWAAEHHSMDGLACPAPDILLGIIGSKTNRIRIGSGAVLLPNYKPLQAAERYHVLATLFPGRVDMGIGRAPGGSAETSIALAGDFLEQVRNFPKQLDELLHFMNGDFPRDHFYSKVAVTPIPEIPPIPWLLGTSGKSAVLAAEKGLPYAYGHFMGSEDGPSIMESYRENSRSDNPESLAAVSVICADTVEEAEEIAARSFHYRLLQSKGVAADGLPTLEEIHQYGYSSEEMQQLEQMKKKQIIGNQEKVRDRLFAIGESYRTDELMVVTSIFDAEARKKSYQLLAEELL